jgi:hypothetical protein
MIKTHLFRILAFAALSVLTLWLLRSDIPAEPQAAAAVINVHDYGATGGARFANGHLSGNLITLDLPAFESQDHDVPVVIQGTYVDAQASVTRIIAVLDGLHARITMRSANARDVRIFWGTDDKEGITKALAAAEAKGPKTALYFPEGAYLIGSTGLKVHASDLLIRGDGMYKSILGAAFTQGPILTVSSARVQLSQLGLDTNELSVASGMDLNKASLVEVDSCRIFRPKAIGIYLKDSTGINIHDSLLESPGDASGTGVLIEGSSRIQVRRCRFRYLKNGVIAHAWKADPAPAQDVGIYQSDFDLGWWLTVPRYKGSGPSVSYTPNSVSDSKLVFTQTKPNATVRNLRPLASGNGSFALRALTDMGAHFTFSGVREGDLVSAGAAIGVITQVDSETRLVVQQWLRDADRLPAPPPASGPYTVIRCLIGKVVSADGHAIRVDTWRDWMGAVQTPTAGTPYEVATSPANYSIHAEPGTREFHVENNTLINGYSDQVSIWGESSTVRHNIIRNGEDMGITLNGGGHEVTDNHIEHQGAGGIFIACANSDIERNSVSDTPWVNVNYSDDVGEIIVFDGAQKNRILKNSAMSRPEMVQRRFGLLVSQRDSSKPIIGNVIQANKVFGHRLADILLSWVNESANTIAGNTGALRRKSPNSNVLR